MWWNVGLFILNYKAFNYFTFNLQVKFTGGMDRNETVFKCNFTL